MNTARANSGSVTKAGCPTSRSFFARCGIPLHLPSVSRFIRYTQWSTSVVSHISRKTSEMWGTRPASENQGSESLFGANCLHRVNRGSTPGWRKTRDRCYQEQYAGDG